MWDIIRSSKFTRKIEDQNGRPILWNKDIDPPSDVDKEVAHSVPHTEEPSTKCLLVINE